MYKKFIYYVSTLLVYRAAQTRNLKLTGLKIFCRALATNKYDSLVWIFHPLTVLLKSFACDGFCGMRFSCLMDIFFHVVHIIHNVGKNYSTNVNARPFFPARPVRPMRCT